MANFFDPNGRTMTTLAKISNLIILNVIWLVCCIPVVTVIPSTTALYYVVFKQARGEDPYICKSFFRSLKQNLKQGMLINILYVLIGIVLYIDLRICISLGTTFGHTLILLLSVLSVFFLIMLVYTSPVLSQFDNTITGTLKNAFLLGVVHPIRSLIVLVLTLFPLVLFVFQPMYFLFAVPLWLLIAGVVIAKINVRVLNKVFQKLVVQ